VWRRRAAPWRSARQPGQSTPRDKQQLQPQAGARRREKLAPLGIARLAAPFEGAVRVLAVAALAVVGAFHARLVALAVALDAARLFAVAAR